MGKKGIKIPKAGHKEIIYRCFSNFNKELFLFDLLNSNLNYVYQITDPDNALNFWIDTFLYVYNKHAPFKTQRVRYQTKPPWLTEKIEKEMRFRDYLLKKYKRGSPEYKSQRNKVTSMLRKSKMEYIRQLISNSQNPKLIWKAIDTLTKNNRSIKQPVAKDIKPDDLNHHFANIADKIISTDKTNENNLDELKQYCISKNIQTPFTIPHISMLEVVKSLNHLKQTGCRDLDGLDRRILKLGAPFISKTLTYIYNLCIDKNYFPKRLKQAKVIPFFLNPVKPQTLLTTDQFLSFLSSQSL